MQFNRFSVNVISLLTVLQWHGNVISMTVQGRACGQCQAAIGS